MNFLHVMMKNDSIIFISDLLSLQSCCCWLTLNLIAHYILKLIWFEQFLIDSQTLFSKIVNFLQQFWDISQTFYVHECVLFFWDFKQQANWQHDLSDMLCQDIFMWFYSTLKHDKNLWLAVFNTAILIWVTNSHWDCQFWHVWSCVLIKILKRSEKHFILWDCDSCQL